MEWNGLPILIFGSGGISKEVYSLMHYENQIHYGRLYDILGFIGETKQQIGEIIIDNTKIVTCDLELEQYIKKYRQIGFIIPFGTPELKKKVFEKFKSLENVVYPNLISSKANVDVNLIQMGIGNIIAPGVSMTCDIRIGNFNLINLNTVIGHDTVIGDFNVINSLVSISGNVSIRNQSLVGTGSQIYQGVKVESRSTVGMGTAIIRDVRENTTVFGVPGKVFKF